MRISTTLKSTTYPPYCIHLYNMSLSYLNTIRDYTYVLNFPLKGEWRPYYNLGSSATTSIITNNYESS